jgi:PAS domain S-box-containing protein
MYNKLSNHLKYTISIGLIGLGMLVLFVFMGYESLYVIPDSSLVESLNGHPKLYIIYIASILIIAFVFTVFSYLAYKILKKNNLINEALIASEKRFRTVFEEAPLGIALVDSETGIIHDANPNYLKIIGYKKEDLGKINWKTITHPDDLPEGQVLQKGIYENRIKNFKITKRYVRPDGTTIWTDLSASVIETKDRPHALYLCMLEDISERKKAEEQIKESREKYSSLVDNATDIILTLDMSDQITFVNEAGKSYTKQEMNGMKVLDFIAEEYHDIVFSTHQDVKKNKLPKTYEVMYNWPGGGISWLLTNVAPIFNNDNVVGLTLFTSNITKRKQIEEALKKSENELRSIFAAMKDIIIEIDVAGKYLNVAPTNPSLLYKPVEELMGKTVNEIFPSSQAQLFLDKIAETLHDNKVTQAEYNLDINGRTVTFEASVAPLTDSSVLWIARDITERKRIEEERIKNQINFEDAQRLARIGSWELNLKTFETQWSKEMYRIFEVENHVLDNLYEAYRSLCDKEDLLVIDEKIKNALAAGEGFIYEHRIFCPSGKVKFLSCIGEVVRNGNGEVVGLKGTEQDITEVKKMNELLKLEALFNGSNDAMVLLTKDKFFECNPKALEIFGVSDKKELIESHPSDFSPPTQPDGRDSYSKANQMIETAFKKGVNRFEWMHQRKNGEIFPAEILLSAFDYGNERVLQATVHDITERKRAEKKLKENEALLSSILQTLPVAVFGKDIKNDYRFSIWNKKAEEIFGLKSEECIGKNDYDFFSEKDADWYREKDIEASKMDGILDIPEEIVESKNKRVIVHTKKTVVRDSDGEPRFLLGVSEDITEQKAAEEMIRKSEEKYRSVVENAADIIITTNINGVIEFVNHIQEGSDSERIVGKTIIEVTPPQYHEMIQEKFKKIIETRESQSFETQRKYAGGREAWYSTNAGPVFSGDEVVGLTFITRDITERKTAEEKTKHSLKEKEILLKEVHHRVKNNLQIILSILNLQYASVSDKKTLDLLRDVRSRIKAMSFIHELLYQTNDFSSINFSEYISNISTNLIYSYTQKQIDLKLDVGKVYLDLDRAIPCGLIINELLTNALKYAFTEQEEGEVSILLKQTDEHIQLVIADNGKGFPAEIDFRNTESLGMQLVMTLVRQLKGEITLDNSNGAKYIVSFKH